MKTKIIQEVGKEEFEKLKEKYPNALVSKRKNGSQRIFLGNRIYVLKEK